MSKPKFSKKKCLTCKWHGEGIGYPVRIKNKNSEEEEYITIHVHCNYASFDEHTSPLRPLPNGSTYDLRGDDYYNCAFYEEGKPQKIQAVISPSYSKLEQLFNRRES